MARDRWFVDLRSISAVPSAHDVSVVSAFQEEGDLRVPATRAEATEHLAKGVQQPRAADRLLPLVYRELRALAAPAWLMKELAGSEP